MTAILNHRQIGRGPNRSLAIAVISGILAIGLIAAAVSAAVWSPERQLRQAVRLLNKPASAAEGRGIAHDIVAASPFTPSALSALALDAQRQGSKQDARRMMAAAAGLSWRDAVTNAWLLENLLYEGKYSSAIRRADALMRTRPDLEPAISTNLIAVASNPKAAEALAERMANQPLWRGPVLLSISKKGPPQAAFAVLTALQSTSAPPLQPEVSPYVSRIFDAGRFEEAYLASLLFLSPKEVQAVDNLFNGKFDPITGVAPFDWQLGAITGASMVMEDHPARPRNRSLLVLSDGFSSGQLVYQVTILPAGSYKFTGEFAASALSRNNPIQWNLTCIGGPQVLQTAVRGGEAWSRFDAEFAIPPECPAQILSLQALPGNRRETVEAWYDSLAIQRVEEG